MGKKIKKLYYQILNGKIVLFFHAKSKKKFVLQTQSQSMTLGSSCVNDIVLLSPTVAPVAGHIKRIKRDFVFFCAQGRDQKLGLKACRVGAYRICVISFLQAALLCVGLFVLFFWGGSMLAPEKRISLAQHYDLPARHTYGNLMDPQTHVTKLSFGFVLSKKAPMTFLFAPGNIPPGKHLKLYLNGHEIDQVDVCLNQWGRPTRVALDAAYLQQGDNTLLFEYTGPKNHPWGIRNAYVEKASEKIKRTDVELFEIAHKLFVERHAKVGNLLRAQKIMQKVLAKGDAPVNTLEKYKRFAMRIDKELERMQKRYLRDARILVRNQQFGKAKVYYDKLLQELIDPVDSLRIEIENEMVESGVL